MASSTVLHQVKEILQVFHSHGIIMLHAAQALLLCYSYWHMIEGAKLLTDKNGRSPVDLIRTMASMYDNRDQAIKEVFNLP